jgi:hypothetical protein
LYNRWFAVELKRVRSKPMDGGPLLYSGGILQMGAVGRFIALEEKSYEGERHS